jgi:putative inorganic carbon (HCO3(-)) transporter
MLYDKAVSDLMPTDQVKKGNKIFELLKQSVPILTGIFIFFNPFPHTTTIKEICFYLPALIVFLLLIFKKVDFSFKTPLSIPFALFVLWGFLGLFFALNKPNSIHDFYAHLLEYLALYYILFNFFQSRKRLICLVWIIIVSVCLFSIGGMIYFYLVLGNALSTRYGFTEMSINYTGFATVFAIILSLHQFTREARLYRKAALLICFLGTFTATLLTQTRGAIIALAFSFIALLIATVINNKKVLILSSLALLIMIGTIVIIPDLRNRFNIDLILDNERLAMNRLYMEVVRDYPIAGTGFGMQILQDKKFLNTYNARVPVRYRQETLLVPTHNLLMDITVRLGLVGLLLYLYIIFAFFRMGWRTIKYGKDDFIEGWGVCLMISLLSVLIQGMFADASFGPQVVVFYMILAMMTILWRLNMESA